MKLWNMISPVFSSFIQVLNKNYSLGKERLGHVVVRYFVPRRVPWLLLTKTDPGQVKLKSIYWSKVVVLVVLRTGVVLESRTWKQVGHSRKLPVIRAIAVSLCLKFQKPWGGAGGSGQLPGWLHLPLLGWEDWVGWGQGRVWSSQLPWRCTSRFMRWITAQWFFPPKEIWVLLGRKKWTLKMYMWIDTHLPTHTHTHTHIYLV